LTFDIYTWCVCTYHVTVPLPPITNKHSEPVRTRHMTEISEQKVPNFCAEWKGVGIRCCTLAHSPHASSASNSTHNFKPTSSQVRPPFVSAPW